MTIEIEDAEIEAVMEVVHKGLEKVDAMTAWHVGLLVGKMLKAKRERDAERKGES